MEKLIKVKHLKLYISALGGRDKAITKWAPTFPVAPRALINYIHGRPMDDKY